MQRSASPFVIRMQCIHVAGRWYPLWVGPADFVLLAGWSRTGRAAQNSGLRAGRDSVEGEADGLVEAEGHAVGIGPLELLVAQGCYRLVEAFLAVARVEGVPRNSGLVEQGLRGSVQHGCPVPVAQIAVHAGQPQGGEGHVSHLAGPAAGPQGFFERGSRAVEVVLGLQDHAQAQ